MENTKTVNAFGHSFEVVRESGVVKGRDGWEAKTHIDLGLDGKGERRRLVLDTGKPIRRADKGIGASTFASLHKETGDGFLQIALMRDFADTVCRGEPGKCTEKAVRACHEKAMAGIDMIIARVVEHHAKLGEVVGWKLAQPESEAA